MMSQSKDNARLKSYKNKALNSDEMMRRREEEGLQLRKQKKDEQVCMSFNMSDLEIIIKGAPLLVFSSYGGFYCLFWTNL